MAVIRSVMASQITSNSSVCSTTYSRYHQRNIGARHHRPLWGKSPLAGVFPTQRTTNAESIRLSALLGLSLIWRRRTKTREISRAFFMKCSTNNHCSTIFCFCNTAYWITHIGLREYTLTFIKFQRLIANQNEAITMKGIISRRIKQLPSLGAISRQNSFYPGCE